MSKIENDPEQNNVEGTILEPEIVQPPIVLTDAEINPFLTEPQRKNILAGKAQDPEWD